jgi:hypothetical protein
VPLLLVPSASRRLGRASAHALVCEALPPQLQWQQHPPPRRVLLPLLLLLPLLPAAPPHVLL